MIIVVFENITDYAYSNQCCNFAFDSNLNENAEKRNSNTCLRFVFEPIIYFEEKKKKEREKDRQTQREKKIFLIEHDDLQ